MRVLGVDPGTRLVGFAILEETAEGGRAMLDSGTIRASGAKPLPERLKMIYDGLTAKIVRFKPDVMAVEGLFYAKNVVSTIRLGEGRAVALLAAANAGLEVAEYSPREVKKATVGHGGAHKTQVARMVRAAMRLAELPQADEADAIAICITHLNRNALLTAKGGM